MSYADELRDSVRAEFVAELKEYGLVPRNAVWDDVMRAREEQPMSKAAGLKDDAHRAYDSLVANGGFSLTRSLKAAQGQAYFVSYEQPNETIPMPEFSPETIMSFRQQVLPMLKADTETLLGGWLDQGMVYLDVSRAFQDRDAAIAFGQANNQLAIWDGFNNVEIRLDEGYQEIREARIRKLGHAVEFMAPIYSPTLADENTKTSDAHMGEQWPEEPDSLMQYAEEVPVKLLLPAREWMRGPGEANFDRSNTWNALVNDITSRGFMSPVWLEWSSKTGMAYIGEGNTRIAVALESGLPTVPLAVYRKTEVFSRGGEIGPFRFDKEQWLKDEGYSPDMPAWRYKIDDGYVPQYFKPHYLIGFMQRTASQPTYLHVGPADLQGDIQANSDGFVHLWPRDRMDLAEDWQGERGGEERPYAIYEVTPPGEVERDPWMGVAHVYRGDIPSQFVRRIASAPDAMEIASVIRQSLRQGENYMHIAQGTQQWIMQHYPQLAPQAQDQLLRQAWKMALGDVDTEPSIEQQQHMIYDQPPSHLMPQYNDPKWSKAAMAERSGDPTLDKLIDQFMTEEHEYLMGGETDPMRMDYRKPEDAAGECDEVSEFFAGWLLQHGVDAIMSTGTTRHEEEGLEGWASPEEFGYHDRSVSGYPDHVTTIVHMPSGTYSVDWTVSQYGYKEFPMVQKLDGDTWQREWGTLSSVTKRSDYQGRTNWETWNTGLMIDNEQETNERARAIVEQGMEQGLDDNAIAAKLRDWAIPAIIGPNNQQSIESAKEWNSIPPEERLDYNYEDFKDKHGDDPNAMDLFHGLVGGPDVSDTEPTLIDPELVNWLEIVQSIKDEFEENAEFERREQQAQDAGIDWASNGGDNYDKMRDAIYRHHGALPDSELEKSGISRFKHPNAYFNTNVTLTPQEFLQTNPNWDNYIEPKSRIPIWDINRKRHPNQPNPDKDIDWNDPEIRQHLEADPNYQNIMANGHTQRLHDYADDLMYAISRGKQHPHIPVMQQALQARGYTPEQIEEIMQQRWRWNPATQEWVDLTKNYDAPPPIDKTLDQPGDFTLPEGWTAKKKKP